MEWPSGAPRPLQVPSFAIGAARIIGRNYFQSRSYSNSLASGLGHRFDAGYHGTQAVGALRSQMFLETDGLKYRRFFSLNYFAGSAIGEQRQGDCHKTTDNVSIGVSAKTDHRVISITNTGFQPNLTDATLNLVDITVFQLRSSAQVRGQVR